MKLRISFKKVFFLVKMKMINCFYQYLYKNGILNQLHGCKQIVRSIRATAFVTELDYLIAWSALSNRCKLIGNYRDHLIHMIKTTVEAAKKCGLPLIVLVPKNPKIDIQSKIFESLEMVNVYELLSQMDVEDIFDKINSHEIPRNFKILRILAISMLKKERNVRLKYNGSMQKFVTEHNHRRYIILSNNMSYLFGENMFWHHKVRVFRKRGITYKKHCFYSLNGADCSKFLRMTVQQKKLLLRFIKQHRGSSEENQNTLLSVLFQMIADIRNGNLPAEPHPESRKTSNWHDEKGTHYFVDTVMISQRNLNPYIAAMRKILSRRYWALKSTGHLIMTYIGHHISESNPAESLICYRVEESLIDGGDPKSSIGTNKFTAMSPHDKLMWICFGNLIQMESYHKKSIQFTDLCVLGIMKQHRLVDTPTFNRIWQTIFGPLAGQAPTDVDFYNLDVELIAIYSNLYVFVTELMASVQMKNAAEHTFSSTLFCLLEPVAKLPVEYEQFFKQFEKE